MQSQKSPNANAVSITDSNKTPDNEADEQKHTKKRKTV